MALLAPVMVFLFATALVAAAASGSSPPAAPTSIAACRR